MNCESTSTFDTSNILDDDDLQINDFNEIPLHASPVKRPSKAPYDTSPSKSPAFLNMNSFPDLRTLPNELFQVTHHLRSRELLDKPLKNDKIEKLLSELEENNSDFELDDQLRTRVFRGRLRKQPSDSLDMKLDSFLDDSSTNGFSQQRVAKRFNDENKENSLRPSKKPRLSDRPRRSMSSIPSLQPLSNITDTNSRSPNRSPQRICVPRRRRPLRPCLKELLLRLPIQIFMVESLTGLVNDATQFGTELNASNCEGFLMPDNVNEIVQIPTNEVGPLAKKKLAIIKAHHSKRFCENRPEESKQEENSSGFYLKREFEEYKAPKAQRQLQVQVHRDSKAVRWADELEW
ncbi:hypothetical protein C7M61_000808 [Candidozyma pseudohaemuli]|uniref:Uncharacterized protein n=1 Tax=Candidozyma pseudohaemuli TaxID=418784 RepID=A0A2P7YYV4_9ASCO|nr:hypothetical protein C7M61_000808 [[Candida] pseudohaemulonii]PSK41136.1 hypothetical protein C7M61_000808 [[Candida] pseudohaemulonii]